MGNLSTDEILKKYKLTLVYEHAIYFEELGDTVYGVLAEDTNYMIRNIGKHSEITVEAIGENLKLLKIIIFENNETPCFHLKSHRDNVNNKT